MGVENDEGGTGYETDDIGEVVRGWWGGCAVGRVGEVDEMCEMCVGEMCVGWCVCVGWWGGWEVGEVDEMCEMSEVRCVCRCVCVGW